MDYYVFICLVFCFDSWKVVEQWQYHTSLVLASIAYVISIREQQWMETLSESSSRCPSLFSEIFQIIYEKYFSCPFPNCTRFIRIGALAQMWRAICISTHNLLFEHDFILMLKVLINCIECEQLEKIDMYHTRAFAQQ
jgi:hypothetical protein